MVTDCPVCLNRNFLTQSHAAQTGSCTDSLFRLFCSFGFYDGRLAWAVVLLKHEQRGLICEARTVGAGTWRFCYPAVRPG
jgi:hypothetical protein